MRIAIIHDWLVTMRGGEKVLEALCEVYPTADLYTIYCQRDKISSLIKNMKITSSFIQKLSFAKHNFRWYLPLFPRAIEKFNLVDYDLIVSTSHCVAKGVVPAPGAHHICYCHSPMRYVWDFQDEYFGKLKSNWITGMTTKALIDYLKKWDVNSSLRVDEFVANSKNIAGKIKRYYKRSATVIYPPVDTDFFNFNSDTKIGDYFLIVSSLVPYKKVDMAIDAFSKTEYKLKIVGNGPLFCNLKSKSSPNNIEFLGNVDKETLRSLYQSCNALIFNQDEDFGIAALEAQACGRPVIAYAKGGALETVIHGLTGVLFKEQSIDSLINAVEEFKKFKFDSKIIRENALRFNNKSRFKEKISTFINNSLARKSRGKALNEALV